MMGTPPFTPWSALKSPNHFSKNCSTSRLKAAVPQNISASPDQPSRSLLCGQSVGMSKKLLFRLHSILCCSLLIMLSEQLNVPVCFKSECRAIEVQFSFEAVKPSTLAYLKP